MYVGYWKDTYITRHADNFFKAFSMSLNCEVDLIKFNRICDRVTQNSVKKCDFYYFLLVFNFMMF